MDKILFPRLKEFEFRPSSFWKSKTLNKSGLDVKKGKGNLSKKKSEFIKSLEKEFKKHWEDTKGEREKTHTTNLFQNLNKKKV